MKNEYDVADEVICGYEVSSTRKKLWVCEIELLELLERTCQENDIDFFLIAGSAIGAIRHQGFIPWDDDIDIGMKREDFEKFLKTSKKSWPQYIDVQYGISEHGADCLLRIRDGRTTGITREEIGRPGNKGAFIEIYVFDYVNKNFVRKIQIKLTNFLIRCMNATFSEDESVKVKAKKALVKVVGIDTVWSIYQKVCRLQNHNKCEYIDTLSLPFYAETGEHLYHVKDVQHSLVVPFEYTTTRVPVGYDNCLRTAFGDYMKLPEIDKRGVHHNTQVFYDPCKSYDKYEDNEIISRFFAGEVELDLL